jgi:hypothetical protein
MNETTKRGVLLLGALLGGCGEGGGAGEGDVRVVLEAEQTIRDGLATGSADEETRDYAVRYTKYLATFGHVKLGRAGGGSAALDDVIVADMKQLAAQGEEIGVLEGLESGEWAKFGFETPAAAAGAKAGPGVSEADLQTMIAEGWTYWIEGEVDVDAERTVKFVIQTDAPTVYDNCELDGEPGVTVVADGTQSAAITLHGDHIFFNAFPTGSEGSIERRAAWVVAADVDGNDEVSTDDLRALDATEVFTSTLGYRLDGAPIPIENALDYVRAQLATQGHYKGEGECIWHFEGASGG